MDRRVRFDKSVDALKAELQREREERERMRMTDDMMQQICERLGNVPPSIDAFCPEEPRPPRPARNPFSQSMYTATPAVPRIPSFGPIGSGRPSSIPFNDSSDTESVRSACTPTRLTNWPNGFSTSRPTTLNDSATRRFGDSYKTSLCDQYRKTKTCNYGENCRYAHDVKELRLPPQANPHYKSTLCRNYDADGTCPFGARCRFVHRREPHHPPNPLSTPHTRSAFASSFSVFSGSRAPSPPKLVDFSSSRGINPWHQSGSLFNSSATASLLPGSRRSQFSSSTAHYGRDSGF